MNKKKKWAKRFLLARAVCRPFVAHLARKEYGFKIPKITLPDGPALIFCNHVTTYDPLLIVAAFKKPCHIVVAKDFIRMKWRKSVQKWFSPIWKDKSLQDPAVPMEIIRYLRAGESVMVFPEGNRTFSSRLCYIGESTAKLARSCRSDILFLNIIGGFTVDPRFSLDFRKGQMEIVYRGMLKKEDVAKMELEEILEKIKENLTVNEIPSQVASISDKRAEKLERVLYRCPVCHGLNHIHSEGNLVKCDACGLEVTYGEHLTFESPNNDKFYHHELFDWFQEQEAYVRSTTFGPNDTIYEESDVNLEDIDLDHQTTLLEHVPVLMDGSSLKIGDRLFKFDEIKEMAVSGKQNLLFYSDGITYRLSSSIVGWNPLKYMQMFYHIRNVSTGQEDKFLGI